MSGGGESLEWVAVALEDIGPTLLGRDLGAEVEGVSSWVLKRRWDLVEWAVRLRGVAWMARRYLVQAVSWGWLGSGGLQGGEEVCRGLPEEGRSPKEGR